MKLKIDILIPVVNKDLLVLPFVIDSARSNIKHPIGKIVIVAPDNEGIKQVCAQKNCKFIDENSVLPITKENIDYRTPKWDRAGWLFQQLLKLSGDQICNQDYYLCLDADTLLIRPHIFKDDRKTVFYCRKKKHSEYYRTYERLLGTRATAPSSFVAHYMLFEKTRVIELKKEIESNKQTKWFAAIIQSIKKSSYYAFSEYETYGNFVNSRYPDQLIQKKTLNLNMKRSEVENIASLDFEELAKSYRSISFHSWNTQKNISNLSS